MYTNWKPEKETHPNWFSEASITLVPKSDDDIKRKSQANIPMNKNSLTEYYLIEFSSISKV